MTILVYDDVFLEHDTGQHPESPARLTSIVRRLKDTGLWNTLAVVRPRACSTDELLAVHTRDYVEKIERACRRGPEWLDQDTIVSPGSWPAALHAAGAVLEAIDRVIRGQSPNAFCLVRPPGHHALAAKAMGFCLFNNVAVGARYARNRHGLERVLIVDWDVHHGNGTQEIFYHDPSVFYFSIHRADFYPGTGSTHQSGRGPGEGFTLNIPIPYRSSRQFILDAFARGLDTIASRFAPDIVLVSAGFDADDYDPVGGLSLRPEDFGVLTDRVRELADHYCGGRLVSVLEGGYNLDTLPLSIEQFLRVLTR